MNVRQTRLCLLGALFFSASLAHGADWPMFHGPHGDNVSTETGLIHTFPDTGPPLLWKVDVLGEGQSGFSSVTIRDGRIFTAGSRQGRSLVFCLDMKGRLLWEYDNGPVWTRNYVGSRSTPTVDGNRVYDLSSMGELACLDVKTGKEIWHRNIFTDFEGENVTWGIAESVRIDGNRLICSPGGRKAAVVALDKTDGKLLWATPSTGEKTAYASAMFFEHDDFRILGMMNAKGLLLIDPETGELLCDYRHTQRFDINCTRPLYHDGKLLIVNAKTPPDNNGAALLKVMVDSANRKVSLEKIWQNRNFDNLHDGVWLHDGFLYGSAHEHRGGPFLCVNWETGETVYESRDVRRGSFTVAENLLYYLDEQGEFRVIRPNPKEYEALSRWTIPEGGEGPTWAHPVIHDKKLYLRHGKFLYCYDIDAG